MKYPKRDIYAVIDEDTIELKKSNWKIRPDSKPLNSLFSFSYHAMAKGEKVYKRGNKKDEGKS